MRMLQAAAIYLARIPLPLTGIALNLTGLYGLMTTLSQTRPEGAGWLLPLCMPILMQSIALQMILAIRACVCWRSGTRKFGCSVQLAGELQSTRAASAYGALLIAVQLGFAHLYHLGGGAATLVVAHSASVLQYALFVRFIWLCAARRIWPEPMWFPPTVSLATPALASTELGTALPVAYAALAAGAVVAIVAWPICVFRVLRDRSLANGPVVFVQMAPVPFVTLALFAVLRTERVEHPAEASPPLRMLLHALLVLNIASVKLTALAAWLRRRALLASLWPLSPAWAALTFPLVSSCLVAVLMANYYDAPCDAAAAAASCEAWASVSALWMWALVPITLVAVPAVDVAWCVHVPRWVCRCCGASTPPRFESISLPEGEAAALLAELSSIATAEPSEPGSVQ